MDAAAAVAAALGAVVPDPAEVAPAQAVEAASVARGQVAEAAMAAPGPVAGLAMVALDRAGARAR